jgi:hypothetical protein
MANHKRLMVLRERYRWGMGIEPEESHRMQRNDREGP